MIKLVRILFFIVLSLGLAAFTNTTPKSWAHSQPTAEGVTLPIDPDNLYGEFENGFKYVIRKNVPSDGVTISLYVGAGTLHEPDEHRGVAHLLQHMAFKGSRHFAPGTLTSKLEDLGIRSVGEHFVVRLNLTNTVYQLVMRRSDKQAVDDALIILSDWADGLLFPQDQISDARAEIKNEPNSPTFSRNPVMVRVTTEVFEGSRIALHSPEGVNEQIDELGSKEILEFWNAWYRPENMTLLVVGDIDPQSIATEARKVFGTLKPRAGKRAFAGGEIRHFSQPRAFVSTNPKEPTCQVQLMAARPFHPPPTTRAEYRADTVRALANAIINHRLAERRRTNPALLQYSHIGMRRFIGQVTLASVTLRGPTLQWADLINVAVEELNRAFAHGLTNFEFELVKKGLLSRAKRGADRKGGGNNRSRARSMGFSIVEGTPFLSGGQRLELVEEMLPGLTKEELIKAFSENFNTKNYAYLLSFPEYVDGWEAPSKEDVLAAVDAAWSRETKPLPDQEWVERILEKLPEPGKILSQTTDSELGVTTAKFSNGVIVHHRHLASPAGKIVVSISFLGGRIEETAENRGVTEAAALVNSTARLSSSQIRAILVGKNVGASGKSNLDTLTITIEGAVKDLETGFRLAHTMITDGKIEPLVFEGWKNRALHTADTFMTTLPGQFTLVLEEAALGADVRLSVLRSRQIDRLTIRQAEEWMSRLGAEAPIEVAMVGDLSSKEAISLAARYLGSLPTRAADRVQAIAALRKVNRGPGPYVKTVRFTSDKKWNALIGVGFVGADRRDTDDAHMLELAARILSLRMNERLASEERLIERIQVTHQSGRGYAGFGVLMAIASPLPENAELLADAAMDMFREFAANGPTADELSAVKEQYIKIRKAEMTKPKFWIDRLGQLNHRGGALSDIKQLPDVYNKYTQDQVRKLVEKYMQDDKVIRIVIIPDSEEQPAPDPAPPKSP